MQQQASVVMQDFRRLVECSRADRYDPATYFDWSDAPARHVPWMPFRLCSLFGTRYWDQLSTQQKLSLSHLEMINLFSLTLSGEREITGDMLEYLYRPKFAAPSEYLCTLLREENDHIYMFGKFCQMYFGRVLEYKHIKLKKFENKNLETLNAFVQTLVAEETLTYYNVAVSKDVEVPALIRKLNERHFKDECRHIAMGRSLVRSLWDTIRPELTREEQDDYKLYVRSYAKFLISDLANFELYRELGLGNPLQVKVVVSSEKYADPETFVPSAKPLRFLRRLGML